MVNNRQQQLHDLYNALQEYISRGPRTGDQHLHHEQQRGVQWALYYEQFRTSIMCDMFREALHL